MEALRHDAMGFLDYEKYGAICCGGVLKYNQAETKGRSVPSKYLLQGIGDESDTILEK